MRKFPLPAPVHNPSKPRLLFVDDDELIRITFSAALRGAGYQVSEACNGLEGFALAEREKPALILLDAVMPKADGWQLLARLQQSGYTQPIIMLSGQIGIEDRIRGLSAGADDYLCKPYDMRELIARVHTALRRCQPEATGLKLLQFGATRVDLVNRSTLHKGKEVELTRTEYAILELFARHPGQLVTRETMLESIWGYARKPNTRTVDTHIWRLRRKLDDNPDEPQWIQTVSAGDGYRMSCTEPST